ncbi:unnamed protein product [Rotaria sp. Silwood2]|nr:unnamed protein product [Rotaria sp. Silwood2]CAF3189566.1 unnamed protein product [Rotaria sp. Silwood2]CAF4186763.1 unnamed protein product [Rotaria sp. Silwood2]
MLDTQYRVHPSLIDFPSKVLYDGSLKTGIKPEQRPIPQEIKFINKQIPLILQKVELIFQTIQTLLPRRQPNLSPIDIGVVTLYTRQVKELVEKLSIRSNNENEIGFLINEQHMNVLLTRAKRAMIVFGNKLTLISNNLWKHWIESIPNITSAQFINEYLIKQNQITDQYQSQSTKQTKQYTYNKKYNNSRKSYPP